ncbi:DUF2805 domain-containing protein [Chryseobacterium sp. legu1]|uniref:DUF2805 domain-containing protein n=1 Tax=Chryseobacterium sp. TaxID=1871047 RepID=UPI0011C77A55|nr:DUF2805 domain-containing protein [Chryseobacterium sp.]
MILDQQKLKLIIIKNSFNDESNTGNLDRIIKMGWENRTPFEAISYRFRVFKKDVFVLMRKVLICSSLKNFKD